jgi:hypothetical protein
MQMLDFGRSRSFQIQHQHIGAIPSKRQTDFLIRTGQSNKIKVLGKADRQILGSCGVILIDHNSKFFHTSP